MKISSLQLILAGQAIASAWKHDAFAYWLFGVMVLFAFLDIFLSIPRNSSVQKREHGVG